MSSKKKNVPSVGALEEELRRVKYSQRYRRVVRSTIFTLISVAAVAVLVATLWLPVLQIYGESMTPALQGGDIVISVNAASYKRGDVVAFYFNNKILVKRVIAFSGDWVDMTEDGSVYINGEKLDEPYIPEKSYGGSDIEYPYQVPEGRMFVMGDHRSTSVDSRHSSLGCVTEEQMVGKIVFRVWPIKEIGTI